MRIEQAESAKLAKELDWPEAGDSPWHAGNRITCVYSSSAYHRESGLTPRMTGWQCDCMNISS
jgi:hypothetical protein